MCGYPAVHCWDRSRADRGGALGRREPNGVSPIAGRELRRIVGGAWSGHEVVDNVTFLLRGTGCDVTQLLDWAEAESQPG